MSFRSPSFTLARHDTRSAYTRGPVSFVRNGRFLLGAIMREAVKVARTLRAGGTSWTWRMRIALRHVWGRAKAEMASLPPASPKVEPTSDYLVRRRIGPGRFSDWDRPIRVRLHGW